MRLIDHSSLKPYRLLLRSQLQATDFERPVGSFAHWISLTRVKHLTESSFGSVRSVTNLKYAVSILKEYIIHWQVQKQDLTKEREVAENLEPKQTEQTHTITVNGNEEEERDVLLRLMLSRSEKKIKVAKTQVKL